jgi:hypothetical protein
VRDVLLVIGVWEASSLLAILLSISLIPLSNRFVFTGDRGIVESWLWQGFPHALVAAFAGIALVWIMERKKPLAWVVTLAALFLYTGSLNAWKWIRRGWVTGPSPADYVGIWAQAVIPALVCLVVGVCWARRCVTSGTAA